jgi:hypothetical protein
VTLGPPTFHQLNRGWNAEPNGPEPLARLDGFDVLLEFFLNHQRFQAFECDEKGILRFHAVSKFRLGPTNDEGWYRGQCRYTGIAPAWGEFYELTGPDVRADLPTDWHSLRNHTEAARHFLFYFRDNTFEALAAGWQFELVQNNALLRLSAG